MEYIKKYIQEHKDRFIEELMDLLRIPSISADPAYSQDVNNCAKSVKDHLVEAGADKVEICPTKGYPIV
ncbi:MAG: peptidase dimerization domain protein, partial [Bacteroidota bacterium]|nr:peptidase dimerization domain protein [Bacteroidota bacterium]